METIISASELARGLSDVLNRIRYRGERLIVERNGEPLAALGPVGARPGITLRELAARLPNLALPGDGYAADLEAGQLTQPPADSPR